MIDSGESRFQVIAPLSQGSMAEVYLCRLQGVAGFEKQVALKRLRPVHADNPVAVRMFLDEARVAAQLSHANIVQVFEVGEQDGVPYLAMEYVRGVPLSLVIARAVANEQLHYGHAARIVGGIAEALAYAYAAIDNDGRSLGLVHRDVCPSNIVVSFEGTPKLLDFGLATASGPLTLEEAAEAFRGDLRYMAPEQISAAAVDHRADVFGLGVVLYELTTGVNPFGSPTQRVAEVLSKSARGEYPRPSALVPGYPPELERIVVAALERDPDRRCWSARELRERLEVFVTTSGHGFSPRGLAAWMRDLFPELVPTMKTGASAGVAPPAKRPAPAEGSDAGWDAAATTPEVQVQPEVDTRPADYEELTETKAEVPGRPARSGTTGEMPVRSPPADARWAGATVSTLAAAGGSSTIPPLAATSATAPAVDRTRGRAGRLVTLLGAGGAAALAGWALVRYTAQPPVKTTPPSLSRASQAPRPAARPPTLEALPRPAAPAREPAPVPAVPPAAATPAPAPAAAASPSVAAPGGRSKVRRSSPGSLSRLARGRGRPRRHAVASPRGTLPLGGRAAAAAAAPAPTPAPAAAPADPGNAAGSGRTMSAVPRSPIPVPTLPRTVTVKDPAELARACQAVEALAVSLAGVSPDFARGITARMRKQVAVGQSVYPIAMYYFIVREALLKRDSVTAAANLSAAQTSGLILQLKNLPGNDKPL